MVDAELVGADAHGRFAAAAPHHESSGLQVDRAAGFLPNRPIDPQFDVRANRQRLAASEGHAVFTHVPRYTVAPPMLDALLGLTKTERKVNPEPGASSPLFCRLLHVRVRPFAFAASGEWSIVQSKGRNLF